MREKTLKDDDLDEQVLRRPILLQNKPICYVIYYNSPRGVWTCEKGTTTVMKPWNFRALSKNNWFVLILGGSLLKSPKYNLVDYIWIQLSDVC